MNRTLIATVPPTSARRFGGADSDDRTCDALDTGDQDRCVHAGDGPSRSPWSDDRAVFERGAVRHDSVTRAPRYYRPA